MTRKYTADAGYTVSDLFHYGIDHLAVPANFYVGQVKGRDVKTEVRQP